MDLMAASEAGNPDTLGVHTLAVPLPGFEDLGCSNAYVLGTGPVTLIDTAPKFPGSLFTLERQLASLGYSWSDVERIILTHGHIDHFGLVGSIREASSRRISCHIHGEDAWRLSPGHLSSGMFTEEAVRFYEQAGIPAHVLDRMRRRFVFFRALCDPIEDILPMSDGDTFSGLGFELRVIHTPGHSPGCCCLYEPHRKILF